MNLFCLLHVPEETKFPPCDSLRISAIKNAWKKIKVPLTMLYYFYVRRSRFTHKTQTYVYGHL